MKEKEILKLKGVRVHFPVKAGVFNQTVGHVLAVGYNLGLWIHNKVVFDRLLVADGAMQPIGTSMAESFDLSSDGMTLTFKLKDGLTFHDGEALGCNHIAFD